ncbi:class I SAM-dependent methyltransferase [Oculatella sp. LEGE 06141]|uniref:class I SAM-dependent methyltransferase n=1 Tax=Oculatella sp. LEGE 06141 TaxID=1828648 RepID=UPI0030DB84ED
MQHLESQKQTLFDRWASVYDSLFPSVFYQASHQRLLDYVTLPDAATVLDLGCGTGKLLDRLAAQFSQMQGTGLDFSAEMLQQARRANRHRPRLLYVQGHAEALPFADAQFDAVFSSFSFLHYLNPVRVLQEVHRTLRRDGRFYLVDFSMGQRLESVYLPVSPGGIRFYPPAVREEMGQQVGLTCLAHYYLLGPVLLSVFTEG